MMQKRNASNAFCARAQGWCARTSLMRGSGALLRDPIAGWVGRRFGDAGPDA